MTFAETRLSEQPIQRNFGLCCSARRVKNVGVVLGDPLGPAAVILK